MKKKKDDNIYKDLIKSIETYISYGKIDIISNNMITKYLSIFLSKNNNLVNISSILYFGEKMLL